MAYVEMQAIGGESAYLVDPVVDEDGTVLRNLQILLPDNETIAITIEKSFVRNDPNAPIDEPQQMEHDIYRIYPYFFNGSKVDPLVILNYFPGTHEVYVCQVHSELEGLGWITFEYKEG